MDFENLLVSVLKGLGEFASSSSVNKDRALIDYRIRKLSEYTAIAKRMMESPDRQTVIRGRELMRKIEVEREKTRELQREYMRNKNNQNRR